MDKYFFGSCMVWGIILAVLFYIRPKSRLHNTTIEAFGRKERRAVCLAAVLTVCVCIVPMGLSPVWNGEIPGHRNQYEKMAKAILEGHLYMDYEVDPVLLAMDNPYDPQKREEAGAVYQWDHAFYNGHYYMYFGVVPVFLLFLPYLIVTGTSLTTYHATQVFAMVFICGVFAFFYQLSRLFFRKVTIGMYLALSSAFAIMSVWYSVGAPALYCTAITAGLCMEIWSLFFFVSAVYAGMAEKQSVLYAFLGSLFGALAFGCRPPVALANILVLPMLAEYLRGMKINLKKVSQLVFAASPYFVIAIMLMAYNYARFGDPFEFGQAYQMTVADQSSYGSLFSQFDIVRVLNGIQAGLVSSAPIKKEFPFFSYCGALVNFPILFFPVIALAHREVRESLKEKRLFHFVCLLFLTPVMIMAADALWSPSIGERYRMDVYWALGALCFLTVGFYGLEVISEPYRKRYSFFMTVWAVATICKCVLLFLVPADSNFTEYYPNVLVEVQKYLTFGRVM